MEISRTNVEFLNQETRYELLSIFGISSKAFIAKGTEAEVYRYSENEVVKIYSGSEHMLNLQILQDFYEAIDESQCGFDIPRILRIEVIETGVAVLERRIDGITLESIIGELSGEELYRAEDLYLQAANELRNINLKKPPKTFMLFDKFGESLTKNHTWESFYQLLLLQKLDKTEHIFRRIYPAFQERVQTLADAIEKEDINQVSVAHGDFFPGNVLVDREVSSVKGVIDFGSFTMFGNHLIDLSSAFAFYKMYDPYRYEIRNYMLPRVLAFVDSQYRSSFFKYLLSQAILTSDLYVNEPDPLDNGHFQWAAEIVQNEYYWEQALN